MESIETRFINKVQNDEFYKLTMKEIEYFIEEHWLEWTCKYDLSPMGHLTLIGKQTLIDGYSPEIKSLINEFYF